MLYTGEELLNQLAGASMQEDSAASSHWQEQHRNFSYTEGSFSGLQGFGGCHIPYHGMRHLAHRAFQRPYRNIGNRFKDFASLDLSAAGIAASQSRAYDLDFIRQSLTLAFLKEHLAGFGEKPAECCVIGDGFASMASLLLDSGLASRVVLVNLTKTLLVDCWYLRLWQGKDRFDEEVALVTDTKSIAKARDRQVVAIEARNHELLQQLNIDLVLNIVSMGEMDPGVVTDYFTDIRKIACRKDIFFYCCNRIEKTLPDNTVVRFEDYPWNEQDDILVDELCPWHQKYYSLKWPFYHQYDGPIKHRLARMACGG